MKLRYFYKLDNEDLPVVGSNINRRTRPSKGRWREINTVCCDQPQPIVPCQCSGRFWVRVDEAGVVVPGSLVKNHIKPAQGFGMRYIEVDYSNLCCLPDGFSAIVVPPESPQTADVNEQYEGVISTSVTGTPYQLQSIASVDYYVDGVLVGTIMGNETEEPGHVLGYTFTLPTNADHTFVIHSVINFEGGTSYTTIDETFQLIYNGPPTFNSAMNSFIGGMLVNQDGTATLSGWVVDPNGPDSVDITFSGLPPFATGSSYTYAGVKVFQIVIIPGGAGNVGNYSFTVTADDGVNPPISRTVPVVVSAASNNPAVYPLSPFPLVRTHGVTGSLSYPKTGNILTQTSTINVAGSTQNFIAASFSNSIFVSPGYVPGLFGEGLLLVTWGQNSGQVADCFLLQVQINP